MTSSVALDQKDVSVIIRMLDDTDGTPATSITAATGGHEIWYRRDRAAVVTDSTSAADMTAITDAHTDWEFKHIKNGYYRVDFPDAAFANGVGGVLCGMDATGYSCVAEYVVIDPLFKYKGLASSVTATTTTFPSGPVVKKGDTIYVAEGTGIGQSRLITSASGQVATHLAWDTNISATTSTIILIAGDATLADGGINVDVVLSTRSSHSASDVTSAIDDLTDGTTPVYSDVRQVLGNDLAEGASDNDRKVGY